MKWSTQCRHLPLRLCVVAVVAVLAVALMPFGFAVDYDNALVVLPDGTGHSCGMDETAKAKFLRIHNEARAAVGVAPLKWSPLLCTLSSDYCQSLAKSGKFEHDASTPFGENLFGGSGKDYTGADAANSWLSEKSNYVYGPVTEENWKKTAHYTQMVWANNTYVGFWVAKDSKGATIVVARYGPGGNVIGETPYPQK